MDETPVLPRAEPVYFGPSERPLFGWIHRPAPGAPLSAEGLVVCNPFGNEALSAHRSLRHVAADAAARGLPAIRFDYDGTGDSAGTDRDPGRVAAWLTSIGEAIGELRRRTGVERVHLLGLRLGGALAALVAAGRDDVAGLVAIAPTVSGKQWLREVDALQLAMRTGDAPPGAVIEQGIGESAGFVITAETRASLAALDLLALPRAPAATVLLIGRAELPASDRWAKSLTALGATVDQRSLHGYTEMMLDPHEAIVPEEMILAVGGWLAARTSRRAGCAGESASTAAAAAAPFVERTASVGSAVQESAVFTDDARTRFGIVSAPVSGQPAVDAILLLNAGANHRVGPGRLHTYFARRWAARGRLVMRMDVSGVGDSAPRAGEPENALYSPWAIKDVEEAVKYLRDQRGARSVVAIGICSGAYQALKAAVAGVPLSGVVVINPLVFFWKEGMSLTFPPSVVAGSAAHYRKSAFQIQTWKKLVTGGVDLVEFSHVVTRRVASVIGGRFRDLARGLGYPLAEDLGAELDALVEREVSVAFVFAGGDPGDDMLRVQAGSVLRRLVNGKQVRIHRIPGANHTFTPVWSQALAAETIERELGIP